MTVENISRFIIEELQAAGIDGTAVASSTIGDKEPLLWAIVVRVPFDTFVIVINVRECPDEASTREEIRLQLVTSLEKS